MKIKIIITTNWIKNFFLVVFSSFISYFLLIIGDWYLAKKIALNAKNINSEARSIMDTRSKNQDISMKEEALKNGFVPVLMPKFIDELYGTDSAINPPLIAGLPKSKTYFCNEGYGLIKYESDRFGFRNKDSKWDDPIDVMFIGDSFVHGACVEDAATLTSSYESLTQMNTINLGIGGNNPSHYLTYINLFVPKFRPKKLFLVLYPNDNGIISKSAIEHAYIDNGNKIFSTEHIGLNNINETIDQGLKAIRALRKKADGIAIKKSFFQRSFEKVILHASLSTILSLIRGSTHSNQLFLYTERSITQAFNLCEIFSCELNLILIPNSKFYMPDSRADWYGNKIRNLAASYSITFFDGRDVLVTKKGSLDYAIRGPHLSPAGYLKITKLITNKMLDASGNTSGNSGDG